MRLLPAIALFAAAACKTGPPLPADDGTLSLSAHASRRSADLVEVELRIRARHESDFAWEPIDLVVLLDASHSVTRRQMELASDLLGHLIRMLQPADRFGLVTFSDDARIEIELAPATAEAKHGWMERLGAVETGGLANLSTGVELAQSMATADSRLVLISDGSPTWGAVSSETLLQHVEREMWTIGVGRNNETLLRELGRYHHLRDPAELADALARELFVGRRLAATALTLDLDPPRHAEVVAADGHVVTNDRVRTSALFEGGERRVRLMYRSVDTQRLGDVVLSYRNGDDTRTLLLDDIRVITRTTEGLLSFDQTCGRSARSRTSFNKAPSGSRHFSMSLSPVSAAFFSARIWKNA